MLSHYTALGASPIFFFFFFNDTATTEIYTLSLHDALPISFVDFDHGLNNAINRLREALGDSVEKPAYIETIPRRGYRRSEEHTSELQSRPHLVCRLLLEKKKSVNRRAYAHTSDNISVPREH